MTYQHDGTGVAGARPRFDSYDVVVIGARVAGAATAMLLGRAGFRVLMIDRAPRGADTTSTHTLLRSGLLQIRRWGLLDRLEETDAPPIRRVTLGFGADLFPIELSDGFGVDALYAPRRNVLDPILTDAAEEAGVEFLDRCRAISLIEDDSGVTRGVVLGGDKEEFHIRTRMVICADGARSRMAKWVGAAPYKEVGPSNSVHYAYYRDVETEGVYFQFTPGVTAGLIPTNDGLVCVYGGWHQDRESDFRSDPDSVFNERVRGSHPQLAHALDDGTRVSGFRGTPGLPGFLRPPGGPGWALVGDAGYTKDPVSAHGISNALRDAELCARAVTNTLHGSGEAGVAFAEYRRVRDHLSHSMFAATSELAAYQWDASRASTLMRTISKSVQGECEALVNGAGLSLASAM